MPIEFANDFTWTVLLDTENDGSFDDPEDDLSADIRVAPGITISRGRDAARPFSPPMVPSFSFELHNVDRAYSAENAGSAYYQLLIPDRQARIQVSYGGDFLYDEPNVGYDEIMPYDGRVTRSLITGPIDEPGQMPGRDKRAVTISGLGSMGRLKGIKISTAQLYSSIRTDTALTTILTLAGWDMSQAALDVGSTTLAYWWLDNADAWDAMMAILGAEGAGAVIYETGDGALVFKNRNHRQVDDRSVTAQATIDDATTGHVGYDEPDVGYDEPIGYDGGSGVGFQAFSYAPGLRDIANSVTMRIDLRVPEASAVASWTYSGPLTLTAAEVRDVLANFTDPVYAYTNVTVTTDYLVTAGSLASVTTTRISATTLKVTFVAGAGGATVAAPSGGGGFQIRTQLLASNGTERVEQTVSGSTIIANTRSLDLTEDARAWPVLNRASAEALCDAAASYYRDPRPVISIEVANASGLAGLMALDREVGDRIHINERHTGVARDVWVEQINYRTEGTRLVRVGLVCSSALDVESPALWDEGLWDADVWGI